jgi:hypothetical protein
MSQRGLEIVMPRSIGSAARLVVVFAAAIAAVFVVLHNVRSRRVVAAADVPVLVELFTSEGCSSCPPADALLARLDAKQPVDGAQVIVLSEHVTYWNSLGWRDPFSSDAMTERQQQYAARFGLGEVYTPQVVVDGAAELVGSDERGLTRAIAKAAGKPKSALTIVHAERADGVVRFALEGDAGSGSEVMIALAQDAAASSVARGENGGRVLHHVAVVRTLEALGKGVGDGRELTVKLPAQEAAGPMRLVVFYVDRRSGHVTGAAMREIRG